MVNKYNKLENVAIKFLKKLAYTFLIIENAKKKIKLTIFAVILLKITRLKRQS